MYGEHKRFDDAGWGDRSFLRRAATKRHREQPDYREELASFFKGALPVQTLIQRLEPLKTNRVEIHDIEPTNSGTRSCCLLEMPHSTAPDLGQGGCQAMEDALVPSTYLQTTNISVEDALKRYEAAKIALPT